MTGRRIFDIFALCFVVVVIFGIVIPYFDLPPRRPIGIAASWTERTCEQIATALEERFGKISISEKLIKTSDVVEFLQNEGFIFSWCISPNAPIAPYHSVFDFSVHLLRPEKLESNSPLLVGYTSPIESRKGTFYRVGLFLRGRNVVAVPVGDYVLEKMIGEETIEQAGPDFYYWHNRTRYLKATKELDSKDKPERGTNEK
ncbi:MAG: hypothetical protein ACYTEL_00085 [Planctomycetota bacterium]|jgi:hypothetical protein